MLLKSLSATPASLQSSEAAAAANHKNILNQPGTICPARIVVPECAPAFIISTTVPQCIVFCVTLWFVWHQTRDKKRYEENTIRGKSELSTMGAHHV